MIDYIRKNLKKLTDELLSKSIYDIGKVLAGIAWTAFIASPFYPKVSFAGFLSQKSDITNAKLLSMVLIAVSIAWFFTYLYYRKRFILIKKDLRTDELTLLPNSRALLEDLPNIISMSRKDGKSVCLIMIDIDDFKNFNAKYNQSIADEVLKKFGGLLRADVRSTDSIYRQHVKGDEFIVVAQDTRLDKALIAADRKRDFIAQASMGINHVATPIQLTVCCGVVELNSEDTDTTLLDRAFEAMKMAKENPGKNTVKVLV